MNLLRVLSNHVRETTMGKPTKKPKGKSARNGNAPAPYTKYHKTPYIYSQVYRQWRADRLARRPMPKTPTPDNWKVESRDKVREFKQAAE